jgi:tetrapyrrole methylase family protein/MazG family protein
LTQIVAELRSEHGCPWDKKQTHESLIPYLIEESYEAIEAIKENDADNLREELGDVLLQVMLHAQIAAEENTFTIEDVIRAVSEKMIRRHPHVFGGEDKNQDLTKLWDSIKSSEKQYHSVTEKMRSVAKSLPSPIYAKKIQAVAAKAGFDFSDAEHALAKIPEESREIADAMKANDTEQIAEECGDLLFSVINVLRLLRIDPEESLKTSSQKFMNRFEKMERMIAEEGRKPAQLSEKELDFYWNQAKIGRNR